MDVIRKILPMVLGLQTVLCTVKYVRTPRSWQNASAYCHSLGYEVSCVPLSLEIKGNLSEPVWINLYTTFTSWFHFIACHQDSNIEYLADEKFVIKNGDIGSCQLACYQYDYFVTKQETCLCFKKLSQSKSDVTHFCKSDDYKVFKKDTKTGFTLDPTKPCEYLYCNQPILEKGLLVRNLTTVCNYNKDQYIAICEFPGATDRCFNYTEFQDRYGSGDVDTDELKCSAYKVECKGGPASCEKIIKPVKEIYKQRVGITSTLVHFKNDTPIVTCGYLNPSYEIEFNSGKKCEQKKLTFFCEKDVTDLSCYKNYSADILPKRLHFLRNDDNILVTTAVPNKLRTPEETTSAGTIVGVIVGLCLVSAVAVIAIVIIIIRLRRRKKHASNENSGREFSQVTLAVSNTAYEYERGSISNSSHYDYIKEPQYYKRDSGYEELRLENNKECDYTDNLEYDHLHGKEERKINTSQQNNLYSHCIPDNDGSAYDKGNTTSNVIDQRTYNTASSNNVTDDDNNKPDVTQL